MFAGTMLALSCTLALSGGGNEAYKRVVARALERAQTALAASVDFQVDHSRWEDPWIVTSAHFEVRTTDSYGQAFELAKQLEFLHAEFVKLLGEGRARSGLQKVWVLPNIGDYNRFGNEHGAEHSSMLGSFYAFDHPEQPVVTYQNGNVTLLGMWVTHSVVHQYVALAFGTQPETWIDEGLASYFALFWDWSFGAAELERVEKERTFVPLARLVAEPIQAYAGTKAHDRFIELGMLFRYLLESCEGTKNDPSVEPSSGPFQEFLRAAVRGQRVTESEFQTIFEQDSDLLEEDFKSLVFAAK